MRAKDVLGRRGEELAAGYLEAQGMRIVDRNWRCPEGEIDIVALDGDALVIAEVKTRKIPRVRASVRGRGRGQAGPAAPAGVGVVPGP